MSEQELAERILRAIHETWDGSHPAWRDSQRKKAMAAMNEFMGGVNGVGQSSALKPDAMGVGSHTAVIPAEEAVNLASGKGDNLAPPTNVSSREIRLKMPDEDELFGLMLTYYGGTRRAKEQVAHEVRMRSVLREITPYLRTRVSDALEQNLESMRQTNAALVKRLSEPESVSPDLREVANPSTGESC